MRSKPSGVRLRRERRIGKERLWFRSERNAVPVEAIEQRFLADAVAGEKERAFGVVPDGKGKHAAETLDAGKANALLKPVVGESSLLLLDGQRHTRERKLMMPPFHGVELCRGLMTDTLEADRAILHVTYLVSWTVLGAWLAARRFQARLVV